MPVCEKCKTPYDEWQHFCLECGNYLRADSPPGRCCPRCGVQVALEQKFCHKCAAPLITDTVKPTGNPSRRQWQAKGLVLGLLGIGVCAVFYFVVPSLMVTTTNKEAKEPLEVAKNAAFTDKSDADLPKTVSLHEDLEGVFSQIREANLTKDILLYMDTLSAVYPHLDKKRQDIFKIWGKYDFKEMAFTLNKIQEVGNDRAVVEVNWNTSTLNLSTKDLRSDDFQYRVWLVKELGHWKIKKIEDM